MSLWTPDGEHDVPREQPTTAPSQDEAVGGIPGAPSLDDLSPEERAQAEAMAAELDGPGNLLVASSVSSTRSSLAPDLDPELGLSKM